MPMDADVIAVYPHAHYLGKLLEAYATLPDGTRKWLARIPNWDLNWQSVFYYREPLALPKDAVISMRFHYDNSAGNVRNPHQPPQLVENGNQSTDEMGHLWLEILPHGQHDRRVEFQEAVMRHRLEKYPNDFAANLNLGALALARLNISGAVAMLENAVRLDPTRPDAHNMLGAALARVGRLPEAIEQLRTALAEKPDYANARLNLANALLRAGKLDEAVADYREVLAETPNDPTVQTAVGNTRSAIGGGREGRTEQGRRGAGFENCTSRRPPVRWTNGALQWMVVACGKRPPVPLRRHLRTEIP